MLSVYLIVICQPLCQDITWHFVAKLEPELCCFLPSLLSDGSGIRRETANKEKKKSKTSISLQESVLPFKENLTNALFIPFIKQVSWRAIEREREREELKLRKEKERKRKNLPCSKHSNAWRYRINVRATRWVNKLIGCLQLSHKSYAVGAANSYGSVTTAL